MELFSLSALFLVVIARKPAVRFWIFKIAVSSRVNLDFKIVLSACFCLCKAWAISHLARGTTDPA